MSSNDVIDQYAVVLWILANSMTLWLMRLEVVKSALFPYIVTLLSGLFL